MDLGAKNSKYWGCVPRSLPFPLRSQALLLQPTSRTSQFREADRWHNYELEKKKNVKSVYLQEWAIQGSQETSVPFEFYIEREK